MRMRIFFETNQGIQFDIEVGDINSLQQIKEKIQTHQGFPVSKQTLSFSGKIIGSDAELLSADIEDGSILHLHISDDQEDAPLPPPPPPPPQDMTITLKMPPPFNTVLEKVEATDTPMKLKRKVQKEVEGTSVDHMDIVLKDKMGRELPDNMTLLQCDVLPHAEVTVELMVPLGDSPTSSASFRQAEPPTSTDMEEDPESPPQPAESQASSSPGTRISVVLKYRERRTTVEVWADQEVRQLRRRLQRVALPEYFFIHNQAVLDENLSFTSQNIFDGHVVEIFPGHVS